jgi:hypothetical protein
VSRQSVESVGTLTIVHGGAVATVDNVRSTEGWACATETVIALNLVTPSGEGIELVFDRTYV